MEIRQADERSVAAESALGNLPLQLTPLLGRTGVLRELRELLWESRLLTLCGPGGAGKSRVAAALAEVVREDLVGGAWWADLADCTDDGLVAQAVAVSVLPGAQVGDPIAALSQQLASSSLLVLDNCEQVAAGCAALATELLARVPTLRVVVTSRQPLGLPGEQVWRVEGLVIEDDDPRAAADEDAGGAIALFTARAREATSAFDPDSPENRAAIADICRWLDGIPLAIELAAARVSVLSVAQIAERIKHDAGLLRRPGRAALPRHRALQETLDWSHRLLEPEEQMLFRRLGALRGNFSLEAAEAVCADAELPAEQVLDLLSRLVDQSLVQVVGSPSLPRYRLLATARQYALGKLSEAGRLDDALRRHAEYFLLFGRQARAGLTGADQALWLQRLELDHDNLGQAIRWLLDNDPGRAAELACALWPFCYQRGYYGEARNWLESALAHEGMLSQQVRVDALVKAGEVAFLQCDYAVARDRLRRALELAGDHEPGEPAAIAYQRLGSIAREQAHYDECRALHEQSMAVWERLGDEEGVAASHNYLGFAAWLAGDCATAEAECGRALAVFRAHRNEPEVATTLISLGAAALYSGRFELAQERLEEALALSRRLGFQEGIAWSLNLLAVLVRRRRRGPHGTAGMLRDALLLHQQLGDRWRMASVLEEIAGALLSRQDPEGAARLIGCAHTLRDQVGAPVPPVEAADLEATLARLRRALSGGTLERALAHGRAQEPGRVIATAAAALEELDTGAPGGAEQAPILTPRELAVLELLSRGHTNREIAASLYISPSTAGVHVSNILRKLSAKRRVDAAQRAHALGLLPAA